MIKVVFQIQVARGALVSVSACLDSVLGEAAILDTAVDEADFKFVFRIHKASESDTPIATRARPSDCFIAVAVAVAVAVTTGMWGSVKRQRMLKRMGRLHQQAGTVRDGKGVELTGCPTTSRAV